MQIYLIAVAVAIVIFILIYNSLVAKKNQVENIFASVDTMLKKRYDLIPNLVASAQEYMVHEKSLLQEVTKLRAEAAKPSITDNQKVALDSKMSGALGSIMVAMENYPELKANENIIHLQQVLHETEEQISAARRAYNQSVTDYNNAIEMIPTSIVASLIGYKRKTLFEIEVSERENVSVNNLFKQP